MTDADILACKSVSVPVAAEYLGIHAGYIRRGLQEGILPFGSAVFGGKEWSYDIRPQALVEYNRHGKRDLLEKTVQFILDAVALQAQKLAG